MEVGGWQGVRQATRQSGSPQPATGRCSRRAGVWELGRGTPTLEESPCICSRICCSSSRVGEAPVKGILEIEGQTYRRWTVRSLNREMRK